MIKTTFLAAIAVCSSLASAQVGLSRVATQLEWRDDLDYLAEELPRAHPDPFETVSEDEWRAAVEDLRGRIVDLSEGQTTFEICRLVAMLGDQNTEGSVDIPMNFAPVLPVRLIRLDDGVFVAASTARYRGLIGKRVVSIGGFPIEKLEEKAGELVAWENESTRQSVVTDRLHFPAALRVAAGLNMRAGILIEAEDENGIAMRELSSVPFNGPHTWHSWVETKDVTLPIAFQLAQAPYSSTFFPEERALLVSYSQPTEIAEFTFEEFAASLEKDANELGAERFIIDLRFNEGDGDSLIGPLLAMLDGRGAFEEEGGVVVLIGRVTEGSAAKDALALRERGALIVGEATGGNPWGFSGRQYVVLPKSGMVIECSSEPRPQHEGSRPATVEPDVHVPWTSEEAFGAKDPALEAAVTHGPAEPVGEG